MYHCQFSTIDKIEIWINKPSEEDSKEFDFLLFLSVIFVYISSSGARVKLQYT